MQFHRTCYSLNTRVVAAHTDRAANEGGLRRAWSVRRITVLPTLHAWWTLIFDGQWPFPVDFNGHRVSIRRLRTDCLFIQE